MIAFWSVLMSVYFYSYYKTMEVMKTPVKELREELCRDLVDNGEFTHNDIDRVVDWRVKNPLAFQVIHFILYPLMLSVELFYGVLSWVSGFKK